LLSGQAQRQKSWACEHCDNLLILKDLPTCRTCYWAYPESFTHVALKLERRIDLSFSGSDVDVYKVLEDRAKLSGSTIQDEIKKLLK